MLNSCWRRFLCQGSILSEDSEHELKDTEQEVIWKTKLEAKKKFEQMKEEARKNRVKM